MLQIKHMEHEHLSFELLKKQKNMTQGKKFLKMLSSVVKGYHHNQIDTAQVIKELSDIAREMKLENRKADDLGLSPEEYTF